MTKIIHNAGPLWSELGARGVMGLLYWFRDLTIKYCALLVNDKVESGNNKIIRIMQKVPSRCDNGRGQISVELYISKHSVVRHFFRGTKRENGLFSLLF